MDFEEIKGWFDSNEWDVGYLTKEQLEICSQTPIKEKFVANGWNFTNDIHFNWVDTVSYTHLTLPTILLV